MLVALERFDLRIPGCGSLKQKRHVLKALTNAIRSTFNVSVAEVDHHELWQRTAIAVAAMNGSPTPGMGMVPSATAARSCSAAASASAREG